MANKVKAVPEQLTKAVSAIVLDDPFYGYLLLRRELQSCDTIDTAATDGQKIMYNPKFIASLTLPQIKGLLKHEVMHIAHEHHLRRGSRDPRKWNEAADYVINGILIESGVTLPEDGLVNKNFDKMSTEHVYSLLPERAEGGIDKWNWGEVLDAPGSEDEATREAMSEDLKVDIIQAHNAAKVMGKNSASIDRLVDRIRNSKMPWKRLLARLFRAMSKDDQSWLKPNKRYMPMGVYLPTLYSESIGPLVVALDTSASVGKDEHEQYLGAINGLLKQVRPECVHVVTCDTQVTGAKVVRPSSYPLAIDHINFKGGGGTSFEPVFEYVQEKRLKPCALLYLTDMEGSFPSKAPPYPVIWCATTDAKAPFGKTVELK